jgi:hypothetical protein
MAVGCRTVPYPTVTASASAPIRTEHEPSNHAETSLWSEADGGLHNMMYLGQFETKQELVSVDSLYSGLGHAFIPLLRGFLAAQVHCDDGKR